MKGFDLDGILIPDMDTKSGDCETLLRTRNDYFPIFYPKGKWCIISGRPYEIDNVLTHKWAEYYFSGNPPISIHLGATVKTMFNPIIVAQYKWLMCKKLNITAFFESSNIQVKIMKRLDIHNEIKIHHWATFINNSIGDL